MPWTKFLRPFTIPVSWQRGSATASLITLGDRPLTVASYTWAPATTEAVVGPVTDVGAGHPEDVQRVRVKLKGSIALSTPSGASLDELMYNVYRVAQLAKELKEAGALALMIASLHYVEHVANIPGKRIARYQVPVMENGCPVWRPMEEFDTSGDGVHPNWPDRFFAKIVDTLLRKTGNNGGRVGEALTFTLSACKLFDFALPLMEAVAADPLAAEPLKKRG